MNLRVERFVPFPRDAVYAWWTDFREDDHRTRGSPSRSRREILRREGEEVWLEDHATRPAPVSIREHVVLQPPRGYLVEARYPGAQVSYAYQFETTAEGTRILLDAEIEPRHIGRILVPLFWERIRRYAERDTDFHLHRMSADLGHD